MVDHRGRDAFTNTVETERYREILRKELRQTDAAMKRQALQKLKEFEDAKKNGVSDLETAMRRKRNSRRYRPTSASEIGQCIESAGTGVSWGFHKGLDLTSTLNDSTLYEKNEKLQKNGFPAAYKCENAHRPVIIADSDPGFFRRTVPSPIEWQQKSGNTLSLVGARSATPGM